MSTLTMVEIIEETVKFYGDDTMRRSFRGKSDKVGDGVCAYNGINDTHCGVGRCLTQAALTRDLDEGNSSSVGGVWSNIEALDLDLQPQYRGHTMVFWEAVQRLHDEDAYWNSDGITEIGQRKALGLMSRFMR